MIDTNDISDYHITSEIAQEDANNCASSDFAIACITGGLTSNSRGRPVGTRKRQVSDGVSHVRLNTIRTGILSMDPSDSRIWSRHGHPRTAYLQKVCGIPDIAQWEIRKACPGFLRTNANNYEKNMKNLTLHQGGWRFQMLRGREHIRRNLKTADLELARKIRDWYCISGNGDFQEQALERGEA